MTVSAYDRVTWRGVTVNRRMKRALEWAEECSGITIAPSQGAYNPGGVTASGTTHAGGGSIDIRVAHLSDRQRKRLVHALKDAGWAIWYRKPTASWGPHLHGVLIGDKEASNSARWQMGEYDAHRTGLSQGGHDGTYRPDPPVRFNFKKKKPVPR